MMAQESATTFLGRPFWQWLVLLALAHSLLFVFLAPPWQHYDEPGHFEYASQIATSGRIPKLLESDPDLRRELLGSMATNNFWPADYRPELIDRDPAAPGENQRLHPPTAYVFYAVPIRLTAGFPLEQQLYAARILSALFATLTAVIAWRITLVVTPDEPMVQVVVPLLVVFTPAFTDLMSALNSDVLLNFSAAAMILGCAYIIRDGVRPAGLALALLGLIAALFIKRTAFAAIVPCGLALFWAFYRKPLPWWMYVGLVVGGSLTVMFASVRTIVDESGQSTLVARGWLATIERTYLRIQSDSLLASISSWGPQIYPVIAQIVFTSFWTRLAWGQLEPWPIIDWLMMLVAVVASIGLIVRLWQLRKILAIWEYRWIWFCLVAVSCAWLVTIMRVHPIITDVVPYIPRGRYAYWAFLPTVWLLALGWQGALPERWHRYGLYALLGLIVFLDITMISVLVNFSL